LLHGTLPGPGEDWFTIVNDFVTLNSPGGVWAEDMRAVASRIVAAMPGTVG